MDGIEWICVMGLNGYVLLGFYTVLKTFYANYHCVMSCFAGSFSFSKTHRKHELGRLLFYLDPFLHSIK